MEQEEKHITSYSFLAKILVVLLALTAVSVAVTWINVGPLTIALALFIATVKSLGVLIWFMHLKYEKPMFTVMVAGVFILYAVIIVITFFDYWFR